jgi:O-6-methylguanine DNA methyltransferase
MKSFNESSPFSVKCYELLKTVPKGKVVTYATLAHALGCRAYRVVGSAMRKNPDVDSAPCYKVVNSNGRVGAYSYLGTDEKIRRLKADGIEVKNGKIDLNKYGYEFQIK